LNNAQLFALTAPLITTSSGAKMGKTAAGAVWLNANLVSPYDYWQYWRNTEDADVARFLKLFTVLPINEIERLSALQNTEINEAKKVLASEATTLVHGREAAQLAAETARTTFEEGGMGEDLPTLNVEVGESLISANTRIGFSSSNAMSRGFITSGAVYLNDVKLTDLTYKLRQEDFGPDGRALLKLGKKRGILRRGSK
jgi:tyrosyl-tRNA synthetase